jgi:thiol-disulfide isomerase/thioredoxin
MTPRRIFRALVLFLTFLLPCFAGASPTNPQSINQPQRSQDAKTAPSNAAPPAVAPSENEELQRAIERSSNDRAALVRNLEAFLEKYPESQQRPQIYRALVEADLQLRDPARATEYAERVIALTPEDMSMTLLAIQLLEHNGDEAGLRRGVNYSTRVLGYIDLNTLDQKSPKVSKEQWEEQQKHDRVTVLLLRGKLYMKLNDTASAEKDFESCDAVSPNAPAEEQLGEVAELKKDLAKAIRDYARAFALSDSSTGGPSRHEIRQKLGNVWRLAHGSDDGLGDYLLRTYDDVSQASVAPRPRRNADAKDPYEFTVRKAPDGSPFPLAPLKGKVMVMNFWATWCGPCRALEPHFEHVAAQFQAVPDVVFLAADCDEDESLVPPYLAQTKPRTLVVFADGLENLLTVGSFPTLIVLDRAGKIAYRADGFDPDRVERALGDAIRRTLAKGSAGLQPASQTTTSDK